MLSHTPLLANIQIIVYALIAVGSVVAIGRVLEKRSRSKILRIVFKAVQIAPVLAFLSISALIGTLHARYFLVTHSRISVEIQETIFHPNDPIPFTVRTKGLPLGAGLWASIDWKHQWTDLAPIGPGTHEFVILAPETPGSKTLTVSLYAARSGGPINCSIITPSQMRFMPPSLCITEKLPEATVDFEVR